MRKLFFCFTGCFFITALIAQKLPCSKPEYRQFDFWIGEWEAFGLNGKKAGDSRISLILDSCIILEEWTSASLQQGLRYAGKSFNTYNSATKQWQQTWVDNAGGSTMAIRKMTLTNVSSEKVRQHGEMSKDNGKTWITEYDLEYRRKKD